MELTGVERGHIKQILQMPQWKSVEHLASMLCDRIAYNSKVKPTQWETLKSAIWDDGQIQGIKGLLQEMYKQALEV